MNTIYIAALEANNAWLDSQNSTLRSQFEGLRASHKLLLIQYNSCAAAFQKLRAESDSLRAENEGLSKLLKFAEKVSDVQNAAIATHLAAIPQEPEYIVGICAGCRAQLLSHSPVGTRYGVLCADCSGDHHDPD